MRSLTRGWSSHRGVERADGVDHAEDNQAWMLAELGFVRREAQAEADLAYLDWCLAPSAETHVVYRAAQDRADAAQDDLAAAFARFADDTKRRR
jgi:hypothetical protein